MKSTLLFLTVACAALFAASQAPGQDSGSVHGRVLSQSAGVPLRGIELYLVHGTDSSAAPSTASREDGSFQFNSVPAGHYQVLEEGELTDYVKGHYQPDARRAVEVQPGVSSQQVVISLEVGAIITGRVTGSDNEPIASLQVSAMQTATIDGLTRLLPHGGTTTAKDGTYQIIRLRAGTYSLKVALKRTNQDGTAMESNVPLLTTFYPGVLDEKAATEISVVADQVVSAMDIPMRQGSVYAVRGIVAGAVDGHSYTLMVQRGFDISSARTIRLAADRSFYVAGLEPGVYSLDLRDTRPSIYSGRAVLAHAEVEVKESDVQGVKLTILPPPVVDAQLTLKGSPDSGQIRLFLRPTSNPTAPIGFSQRDSSGAFVFRAPSAEPNVLTVTGLPAGMAVQNITFNGKPVMDAVIDLSAGGGHIGITIGPSGKQ